MFLSCGSLLSGLQETNANNIPNNKMLKSVFFIFLSFGLWAMSREL
jgi:hypothetical protein